MIVKEYNKINGEPVIRITSDLENYFVKIKDSGDEPRNEIIIYTSETDLEFEEVYIEPQEAANGENI